MDIRYEILSKIVNMSITGTIVILIVLVIRTLLCKAPKKFPYMLWGVVLFRLLCPVPLPSMFSVLDLANVAATDSGEIAYVPNHLVGYGEHLGNLSVPNEKGKEVAQSTPVTGGKETAQSATSKKESSQPGSTNMQENSQIALEEEKNTQFVPTDGEKDIFSVFGGGQKRSIFFSIGFIVWLAGVGIFACSGLLSAIRLHRQVSCSIRLRGNIYLADYVVSPFVFGFLQPKIYLPSILGEKEQAYIILHEQYHIFRRDYLMKILAFLALCVHWFNPFVWAAFMLSGKDMEMSCDEAVLGKMKGDIRAEYAKSLLKFAAGRPKAAGMPLAFGESDVKDRIKNVMNYKKPSAVAGIIGVFACLLGGICLITNPMSGRGVQKLGSMGNRSLFAEGNFDSKCRKMSTDRLALQKNFYPENGQTSQIEGREKNETEKEIREEAAIQDAIIAHNWLSYPEGVDFVCSSFVSLERKYSALANKFTFYGWAYYSEYNFSSDGLEDMGGSHMPVALTFQVDGDKYILEEYWEPRDGDDFEIDVRKKFPAHIVEAGLDSQKYVLQQIQDCYAQAVAYGQTALGVEMDIDAVIGHLLDVICSGLPSKYSNQQEYINAHEEEYRELIYYKDYTVRYCLARFEQGRETGLESHIMALACEEIAGIKGKVPIRAEAAENGQAWYDALRELASTIRGSYAFVETEEIDPYEVIGIPVSLPENKNWIQKCVVEEFDESHLQIQYYDSILAGQCILRVVKDGEIDLPDIEYEEGMDETWEGHTVAERRVEVKVRHAKDWVLASWEYENYKFAILGEISSQQNDTSSVPKVALGIIMGLM